MCHDYVFQFKKLYNHVLHVTAFRATIHISMCHDYVFQFTKLYNVMFFVRGHILGGFFFEMAVSFTNTNCAARWLGRDWWEGEARMTLWERLERQRLPRLKRRRLRQRNGFGLRTRMSAAWRRIGTEVDKCLEDVNQTAHWSCTGIFTRLSLQVDCELEAPVSWDAAWKTSSFLFLFSLNMWGTKFSQPPHTTLRVV